MERNCLYNNTQFCVYKQTHLFNALLAEAVQAFHERVRLAHDRQADGARELGVQEARRNARTVVGVRDHRAPCQNKKIRKKSVY